MWSESRAKKSSGWFRSDYSSPYQSIGWDSTPKTRLSYAAYHKPFLTSHQIWLQHWTRFSCSRCTHQSRINTAPWFVQSTEHDLSIFLTKLKLWFQLLLWSIWYDSMTNLPIGPIWCNFLTYLPIWPPWCHYLAWCTYLIYFMWLFDLFISLTFDTPVWSFVYSTSSTYLLHWYKDPGSSQSHGGNGILNSSKDVSMRAQLTVWSQSNRSWIRSQKRIGRNQTQASSSLFSDASTSKTKKQRQAHQAPAHRPELITSTTGGHQTAENIHARSDTPVSVTPTFQRRSSGFGGRKQQQDSAPVVQGSELLAVHHHEVQHRPRSASQKAYQSRSPRSRTPFSRTSSPKRWIDATDCDTCTVTLVITHMKFFCFVSKFFSFRTQCSRNFFLKESAQATVKESAQATVALCEVSSLQQWGCSTPCNV